MITTFKVWRAIRKLLEIDGHRIKLSNLEKVLYPADEIIKAEWSSIIWKFFLRHNKYRPCHWSGIRMEFQPWILPERPAILGTGLDWINPLGQRGKKDYIFPDQCSFPGLAGQPSLSWVAYYGIYQTRSGPSRFDGFDLDRHRKCRFDQVKQIAYLLKEHLLEFEYHPL